MKQLTYIAFAAIMGISVTSCTKVIDVNLDKTEPIIVIEGNLTDTVGPAIIKVTQTIDIDKNNNFPGVSGAVVTISDDANNMETLQEVSAGIYQTQKMIGVSGRTYTLTVQTNGKTYTAVSTMPQKIAYDSLGLKEIMSFDGPVPYPTVYYRDPVGIGNFYRAVRYVNNIPDGDLFVESDEFIDGKSRAAILFNGGGPDEERVLLPGDVVTVEMQCINKQIYDYLVEREEADGNSQAASPANPTGNISNGAVGYFSTHTSETKVLQLP